MFARIMIIDMKKVLYILVGSVGILAASCSKESIRPTAQTGDPIPQWKSSTTSTGDEDNDTDGSGTITDPNSDRDDNSRKRPN